MEPILYHKHVKTARLKYLLSTSMYISDFKTSAFVQRITIPELLVDEWFKKDYKPPVFDDKEYINLDDVEAVFKDSEVRLSVIWTY